MTALHGLDSVCVQKIHTTSRQITPVPIVVFEVRHIGDLGNEAVHRPISLELTVEQVVRQLLPGCLAGARLRLAHLANACNQAAAAHDSLQRSLANLYAVTLMQDGTHAASANCEEAGASNLRNLLGQLICFDLRRRRLL